MMATGFPGGVYTLAPGVRLLADDQGGVVLQASPLRTIRVNKAAFSILQKCNDGLSFAANPTELSPSRSEGTVEFLDSMCQLRLLSWKPRKGSYEPFVSIIVPVYNRAHEIHECLTSLLSLSYPRAQYEVIVVDDGSTDDTAAVVKRFQDVKLIVQKQNGGQSAARNVGVRAATGEIVAFVDSDCIADPHWLNELTPYFQDNRIVLVGGYVGSHYNKTWLDRYEEAKSPLNMGSEIAICASNDSDFYVPTCNMLVRKEACQAVGGLDESWRVGEDVDLCWKLKKLGHRLIYVSEGRVRHKHRNRFWESFRRRFDYGTSEPALYSRHTEVWKRFPRRPLAYTFFAFLCLGLLSRPWLFWPLALATALGSAGLKRAEIKRKTSLSLDFWEALAGTARNDYNLAYYLSFYLVRYHLFPIFMLMLLFSSAIPLGLLVVFPCVVEFLRRKPRLNFPLFFFFYVAEQLFYQSGVLVGCFRTGNYRCYVLRLAAAGRNKKPAWSVLSRFKSWRSGGCTDKVLSRQHQ